MEQNPWQSDRHYHLGCTSGNLGKKIARQRGEKGKLPRPLAYGLVLGLGRTDLFAARPMSPHTLKGKHMSS